MVFEVSSRKKLEELDSALRDAAARHGFGVLSVHDLRQTMAKKGVDYSRDCLVYEVCNPHQAKKVLDANPAISTALPCRISVYQDGEEYKLATMAPTEMLGMYSVPELQPVAQEVEREIYAIMRESA